MTSRRSRGDGPGEDAREDAAGSSATSSPAIDFRAVFHVAHSSQLLLVPPDFTIVAASDAYLRATMTEREAILGRALFEVFPGNPLETAATGVRNLRASLERALASRRPDAMAVQQYDIPRPASAGGGFEERWWSAINTPVLAADGTVSCLIHRVEDVTALVGFGSEGVQHDRLLLAERAALAEARVARAEVDAVRTALHMEQSRLAEVFRQAPVAVAVARGRSARSLVIEMANPFCLELVPPGREVVGRRVREALPELPEALYDRVQEVLDTGEPVVFSEKRLAVEGERAPGEERYFNWAYRPLHGPDGDVVGVVAAGVDVTGSVLARQAAERMQQEAESARADAEAARQRAERLQRLASALGRAVTPGEVADVTLDEGLGATGSAACRFYALARDGRSLEILVARGRLPGGLAARPVVPLDAHAPEADAAREGFPVWIETEAELRARYPALVDAAHHGHGLAVAALPVVASGRPVGALAMVFDHEREFAPAERANIGAVVALAGQAIERAHLFQAERAARAEAERARVALERSRRMELDRAAHEEIARNDLRRQLASAEEDERRRLSLELHDRFGQHLTAIALGLDAVAAEVPAGGSARRRLVVLQQLTQELSRDARHLAVELRPPELDDVGLESALETYVARWSERAGVPAELAITGLRDRVLPGEIGTTLYRIVQEALTNVARHAGASHASVIVSKTDGEVRVIVEDDGRGFDHDEVDARVRRERRLGLAGMRERVGLVGGSLVVESFPGRGTTVYVQLPLDRAAGATEASLDADRPVGDADAGSTTRGEAQ